MPYDTTAVLDQVSLVAQQEVTFNGVIAALSPAALYGVKTFATQGLDLTLYGGNFPLAAGGYIALTDSLIRLTPSTTNYIYATAGGIVTKTTSAPAGWPGPMGNGSRSLYQLVVGADSVTSGTDYVTGAGPGPMGAAGAVGPSGADIAFQRKRYFQATGGGSTQQTGSFGWDITSSGGGFNSRTLDSSSFQGVIPFAFCGSGGGVGTSAYQYSNNFCYLGNASGRGGFQLDIRWGVDSTIPATAMRSFFGLSTGLIGNVEPDTITNLFGVGSKSGDANYSLINNDGTGSATVTALGSNYPAKSVSAVYELRLYSAPNSGSITYTLTRVDTGNFTTATVSTDIPTNTAFLGMIQWMNSGSDATGVGFNVMQAVGYTRY
jgi:hypothetical protein